MTSAFSHKSANKFHSASLRAIFEEQSPDWVVWTHDRSIEVSYDGWGKWLVRTNPYVTTDLNVRLYKVWAFEAITLSTLRRKIASLPLSPASHRYLVNLNNEVIYEYE